MNESAKMLIRKYDKTKTGRWQYLLIAFLLFVLPISAQFESQISQYMLNMPSFNPAAVGENGMINVSGQHRIQWVGVPGAPQSTFFSINTPFKMGEKVDHGLGIKFLNDKIGAFNSQAAHFQYAFKRKIGKGKLSAGVDVGFVNVGFVHDSIKNANVNADYYDFLGDAAIPKADDTGISFDLTAGLFYSAPKYYLGVSYVHLNTPKITLNEERTKFDVRGVLYFTGGYDFVFKDPKWKIRSSSLVKSDFITWQAELTGRLMYDERFWGGLSYRFQDAAVVLAGINVMNGMQIGYAYDLPVGKMLGPSSGSHEVFLSYSFLFDMGKKNSYKSIRIL